jgi:glycosyltransferase involved in cell wall biosynthesis
MAVIAIVTSAPPLTEGGHLVLARSLQRALSDAGHRASIVTTPSNRFGRQMSAYLANRLTDVGVTGAGERVDQVISLRYPAFTVRHPAHVCWLVHTMREYYDLWSRFSQQISVPGQIKEGVRRAIIHAVDSHYLKRVSRLYAISQVVADRAAKWNRVRATVLHPPPAQRAYRCDEYGDFLFFASRLSPLKRADLVLRALATPSAAGVKCVFAGEGEVHGGLVDLARELGVESRVTFAGHVSDEQLVDYLARCRGVVFVPHQEDYGFVTVEAFAARKPVITCHDSGGPLELVKDGANGLVVDPDPDAVGRAMAALASDAALAERLGRQAETDVAALSWERTVRELVIV